MRAWRQIEVHVSNLPVWNMLKLVLILQGNTSVAYAKAMGENEMAWALAFTKSRKATSRTMEYSESLEGYIRLLENYLKVAPSLVPPIADADIHSATLWHPDLHRDNVFVDPITHKITQIIDWQSAMVAPLFLQCGIPRMFRYSKPVFDDWTVPEKPPDYDNLTPNEKKRVDNDVETLTYHKYYSYQTLKRNARHWTCLDKHEELDLRTKPIKLVTKAWKNDDIFYFRDALLSVIQRWEELDGSGAPCPISICEDVYRNHEQEEANRSAVGEILRIFRDESLLPVDGMVCPEDYELVQNNNRRFKKIFINLGTTPEEKSLHARLWPYQDTASPGPL
jgi:hypothetical protein